SRNFQPNVFLLHVEIGDHRVKKVPILKQFQCSGATVCGAHGIAFSLKNHLQCESHIGFIVDDKERILVGHREIQLWNSLHQLYSCESRKSGLLSLPGSLQSMVPAGEVACEQQPDDV